MSSDLKLYLRTVGLRGLLAGLGSKLGSRNVMFQVTRKDCRHPLCLRLLSSDVSTYEQVFVNFDYAFEVQQAPVCIVDAGANIGLASIYFANRFPSARIIAIEPEQSNYELLKDNLAPYPQVTTLQAALWHRNKEVRLVDPGLGNWGFMTEGGEDDQPGSHQTRHTVKAVTMDWILNAFGLDRIDILKVDIEGAEKEVFADTTVWIDRVDAIIIELHERYKKGCNRSFYCGSPGFAHEWTRGENVYLSRGNLHPKGGGLQVVDAPDKAFL
jgi:FkbM family methyltransferase